MSESGFGSDIDLSALDFDALYTGGSLLEGVAFASIPWDIGKAQPVVVALARAGRFRGAVVDVGCGLGDNAIYLASKGYRVTGLDVAQAAVERARQRAAGQAVDVEFAVADATTLAGYDARFDSVLDSACYHCLDEDGRRAYAAALHRATTPGALLNLFCFVGVENDDKTPAAIDISEQSLRTTLTTAGWEITDLRQASYMANADVAAATESAGWDFHLTPGEDGYVQMPVWALQARRA